ncbi:prepilin-type N-terminal cleavage/methylation domain-containing protein [Planococcus sp. MERTA32b]|nr:prepilin-type N-terminal cleavage/methylation domain-containing protein [Planococcus sp. MER TA 32b]
MKKFMQKRLKNEKGMTLIELLAVIVILAIIAAIAIPAIGGIIENSKVGAMKSDAQTVLSAGELYFIDKPEADDVTLEDLVKGNFVDDLGTFKNADKTKVTVTKKTTAKDTAGKTTTTATTISGTAVNDKIQVVFDKATKENISKYANSDRGAVTAAPGVNAGPVESK